jgi:hypothetical protein
VGSTIFAAATRRYETILSVCLIGWSRRFDDPTLVEGHADLLLLAPDDVTRNVCAVGLSFINSAIARSFFSLRIEPIPPFSVINSTGARGVR